MTIMSSDDTRWGEAEDAVRLAEQCCDRLHGRGAFYRGSDDDRYRWIAFAEHMKILGARPEARESTDGDPGDRRFVRFTCCQGTAGHAEFCPRSEHRMSTGMAELDLVLGGGIVPGSLILLLGDPGIGKFLLLERALDGLAQDRDVMHAVTSDARVPRWRCRRHARLPGSGPILFDRSTRRILRFARRCMPAVLAVDSLDDMRATRDESAEASAADCVMQMSEFARATGAAVIVVGTELQPVGRFHRGINLHHVPDVILRLDNDGSDRILSWTKNRYSTSWDIGRFQIQDGEMVEAPRRDESRPPASEREPGEPSGAEWAQIRDVEDLAERCCDEISGIGAFRNGSDEDNERWRGLARRLRPLMAESPRKNAG